MGQRDPRVDAYIARAAPFAQPILARLREWVHAASPEAEETIKWSMPHFVLRGRNLAHMAAFKQHASFGFWQHAEVMGGDAPREGMGSFGRLAALRDLPPRAEFLASMKRAVALIASGERPMAKRQPAASRAEAEVPDDLAAALRRSAPARRTFEGFPPGHRREYIEWLQDAKRPETRARRLAQAIEWLAEGKSRNWKYQRR